MTIGGTRLLGRLIGMPAAARPAVDDVEIVDGSYLSPEDPDGVLVEKHAATTFGLVPGDHLEVATPSGWHEVTVRGVVVSPEYLWPARSRQEVLGDPHGFAVVLAAQDQVQAWSGQAPDQALVLLGGASAAAVTAALRRRRCHRRRPAGRQPVRLGAADGPRRVQADVPGVPADVPHRRDGGGLRAAGPSGAVRAAGDRDVDGRRRAARPGGGALRAAGAAGGGRGLRRSGQRSERP